MFRKSLIVLFSLSLVYPQINVDKFKQLNEDITTPNTYRTASGYPGHDYWQPEADYVMKLKLDDKTQRLYGEETITFHNNSPDQLNYLWIQLDQTFVHSILIVTRFNLLGTLVHSAVVKK